MKYKFLLLLLLSFSTSVFAQNGVKITGFYREILPGIVPRGTDEGGQPLPKRTDPEKEYLIYVTAPSGKRIQPVEIWVDGKQYTATHSMIKSPQTESGGKVLVPKTNGGVWKITPGKRIYTVKYTRARDKAKTNEVVVVYRLNGTFYSATLGKLTHLEPVNNE